MNYQTGSLTEEQIKNIHEALKEKMEACAEAGLLEETNQYAELQELFGDPEKNLIKLDE